ncbi:hypothetical protein CMK14_20850 [Candidatus Poribacteria bacterium]|nr:hypothetical protein [Candidatus Poribacteria bacterium]
MVGQNHLPEVLTAAHRLTAINVLKIEFRSAFLFVLDFQTVWWISKISTAIRLDHYIVGTIQCLGLLNKYMICGENKRRMSCLVQNVDLITK